MVKAIIQGMLIHTITIYDWPISLIKEIEKNIRNFIWSGDVSKRKLLTVSWKHVCKPTSEGGLGIRSISAINQAANLRLCWNMMTTQESWGKILQSRVIRKNKAINYHIFSSIWSSIKSEYNLLIDNTKWLLGDGESINFWTDHWCSGPLINLLSIPNMASDNLSAKVCDFIHDFKWMIPQTVLNAFPNIVSYVHQITIPLQQKPDNLIWLNSSKGDLTFKDAYLHKAPPGQNIHWAKIIWSQDVPPSKSLTVWRIMHNKLPTDENLSIRGCYIPSICNCCHANIETSSHLFFECPYASKLWNWLASVLNMNLQFTSYDDVWKICDRNWSSQCKVVVKASLINIFSTIWYVRNQARFNDKAINWRTAINLIISSVALSGNLSRTSGHCSIQDFSILKHFNIKVHPPDAPLIKEVIWSPPNNNWIKCNTDGASIANQMQSACGGIFRNSNSDCLGCFASNLGPGSAILAEFCAAMTAIEIADEKGWRNFWLETDSKIVMLAFSSSFVVPWCIRNKWANCLYKTRLMNFIVSHIYREGNTCADFLANIGLTISDTMWWDSAPLGIGQDLIRNKLGLPNYRFVNC